MAADRATEARQDWPLETCQCVICPDCAFTFDASHVTQATGLYDCPACAEQRLLDERERLTEAIGEIAALREQTDVSPDIPDFIGLFWLAVALADAALSAVSGRKPA